VIQLFVLQSIADFESKLDCTGVVRLRLNIFSIPRLASCLQAGSGYWGARLPRHEQHDWHNFRRIRSSAAEGAFRQLFKLQLRRKKRVCLNLLQTSSARRIFRR